MDRDIEMITKLKSEERLWQMWLAIYPNMDKDTFVSYEDYLKQSGIFEESTKRKRKSIDQLRAEAQKLKERRMMKDESI